MKEETKLKTEVIAQEASKTAHGVMLAIGNSPAILESLTATAYTRRLPEIPSLLDEFR